jgi:hypothetical protein
MRALCALAFLLAAAPAHADNRQFGNVVFDTTANWRNGANRDGVQILIHESDEVCQYCYMYVALGSEKQGDVTSFLESQAQRFVDEDDRGDEQIVQGPGPIMIGDRQAAMMGLKVRGTIMVMVAVDLPDRYELFGFEGVATDEETMTASLDTFQSEALPVIFSATYLSEGAEPVMPPPEPGDMQGIWWGWDTTTKLGLDGMMKTDINYRKIVFWPDGYFYDGSPPLGLKPLDPAALIATGDMDFGTYRIGADGLTLSYADGSTEVLEQDGTDWSDGSTALSRVEPLADGETLDGTLSSSSYSSSAPGTGVSISSAGFAFTAFHPDGTYESSSSGSVAGNIDSVIDPNVSVGGFGSTSESAASGTYEIRDGLLTRHPADGSEPFSMLVYRALDDIMVGSQVLNGG